MDESETVTVRREDLEALVTAWRKWRMGRIDQRPYDRTNGTLDRAIAALAAARQEEPTDAND
jgi:hypothetical protein